MKPRIILLAAAVFALGAMSAGPGWSVPSWPQAQSDIKPDPAVRFGVLANGMRYAIMRNATPGGQTSLRLRVGSGSLEESDAQQGLAHVLEHMSFKGSTHVPTGEMVKILERKGLAFGPDTNAETEWTQTVYMLDLPHSDADTLDTGLMLMRETASELTLSASALEPERGVVLSEERLRDTPDYRAEKAQIGLLAQDQRITQRFPIGLVDVIKNAPPARLRDYYRANYRPERTTLIAVGDFDPAAMEGKIKARFSDWVPIGQPTAEPDLGAVAPRGLTAKVVQLPGASTRALIAWVHPHDDSPDTFARRRRDTIDALALAVLNRRLSVLAHDSHPPFLEARAVYEDLLHSDKVAQVEALSPPDGWRPALAGIEHETRRMTQLGIAQVELDREIVEMRAALANSLAGASTRRTPALAGEIVDAVDNNEVVTDPATDLAIFEKVVKGLTADDVVTAARAMFSGAGPLVELTGPMDVSEGDAGLAAELRKDSAEPVAPHAAEATVTWPYEQFGPAGRVVEQTTIPDLGAQSIHFANGVGLIVKPTAYRKDQILVTVRVGSGRLGLSRDNPGPVWAADALIGGGLGRITFEDSQRALAGRIYAAAFGVGDDAFTFTGATQPKDLAIQLEVLAAYLQDPGFRPEAFERLRAAYLAALPQLQATPGGVVNRDLDGLLHAGDPRWTFPRDSDLKAANPSDLKALLGPILAHAPIEVTIVGDIDLNKSIELASVTFGALPSRPPVWLAKSGGTATFFPAPTSAPVIRRDTGRADQAEAVMAWPTTDFFADMKRSRAGMLAGEVLQNRILETVRIGEGATYSPQTEASFSETLPGYGAAISLVEMPPGKIPHYFETVSSLTADLSAKGLTQDELERARNPHVAGIEKAQLTNEYWLDRLAGAIADPRRLTLIRTTLSDYQTMTAADVQAAAKAYFVDARAWKLVVSAAN